MSDSEIAALLKDAMLGRDFGQNFNACIGWLVLIGAFTGARAGELCALTKDDVREKDEIPFIAIRSGKTENATRVVPLHPQLIEAGFLEYVATCQDELFGITGKTLSKRFPAYRRDLGVDRPGVVFHSLRKTVVTILEGKEVAENIVAHIVGHKITTMTYGLYSGGVSLAVKRKALAKLAY